jgi:hypothetical protein
MNRLLLAVTAALAVAVAGCPIYSDNQSYQVCTAQACFDCPDNAYSSACVPWPCQGSLDCPQYFVCNFSGQCVASTGSNPGDGEGTCIVPSDCEGGTTCGSDNICHAGDCGSGVGCPTDYACTLAAGIAQCLSSPEGGAPGGDVGNADASGTLGDGGDATVGSGPSDGAAGDGGVCIDGSCQ